MIEKTQKTISQTVKADRIAGELIVSDKGSVDLKENVKSISELAEKISLSAKTNISSLNEVIIVGTIILDGSDIHI